MFTSSHLLLACQFHGGSVTLTVSLFVYLCNPFLISGVVLNAVCLTSQGHRILSLRQLFPLSLFILKVNVDNLTSEQLSVTWILVYVYLTVSLSTAASLLC